MRALRKRGTTYPECPGWGRLQETHKQSCCCERFVRPWKEQEPCLQQGATHSQVSEVMERRLSWGSREFWAVRKLQEAARPENWHGIKGPAPKNTENDSSVGLFSLSLLSNNAKYLQNYVYLVYISISSLHFRILLKPSYWYNIFFYCIFSVLSSQHKENLPYPNRVSFLLFLRRIRARATAVTRAVRMPNATGTQDVP